MSERFFETPETNVKMAALKLMRFKTLCEMSESASDWVLKLRDVNEILTVAGLPVIIPNEIEVPEVDIIKTNKEVTNDTV